MAKARIIIIDLEDTAEGLNPLLKTLAEWPSIDELLNRPATCLNPDAPQARDARVEPVRAAVRSPAAAEVESSASPTPPAPAHPVPASTPAHPAPTPRPGRAGPNGQWRPRGAGRRVCCDERPGTWSVAEAEAWSGVAAHTIRCCCTPSGQKAHRAGGGYHWHFASDAASPAPADSPRSLAQATRASTAPASSPTPPAHPAPSEPASAPASQHTFGDARPRHSNGTSRPVNPFVVGGAAPLSHSEVPPRQV
jgi:hypothetical protein